MKIAIAAALALLGFEPAAAQTALRLRCVGAATHQVASTTYANVYGSDGGSAWGNATNLHRETDDASVAFEMADGAARIRLPSDMVPLISGGGQQGWWNVTDLHVDDDEIEGRYSLNVLNHPRVRIDRHSGRIDVEGRRSFHGECESVADAPRKF